MGEHSIPADARKSEPVLVCQSVLAALAFVFGGITTMAATAHNDVLAMVGGVGTLLVGGANIGVGFFVRGQVVPYEDVAAMRTDGTQIVAGPASPVPDGLPVKTLKASGTV